MTRVLTWADQGVVPCNIIDGTLVRFLQQLVKTYTCKFVLNITEFRKLLDGVSPLSCFADKNHPPCMSSSKVPVEEGRLSICHT